MDQNSKIQTISHLKSSKLDIADQKNLTVVNSFVVAQGQTMEFKGAGGGTIDISAVSYTHLRAHETREDRGWAGGR